MRFLPLVVFLVLTFGAAALGSFATFRSVETWYPTLVKPSWNPPRFLFGPVWTALYIAMSIAGWRAWSRTTGPARRSVTLIYGVQIALNALWSVLFFGLRRPDLALVEILLLWIVLVVALVRFARIDRLAGVLWTPYVLWVSFATALNAAIWHLNR